MSPETKKALLWAALIVGVFVWSQVFLLVLDRRYSDDGM